MATWCTSPFCRLLRRFHIGLEAGSEMAVVAKRLIARLPVAIQLDFVTSDLKRVAFAVQQNQSPGILDIVGAIFFRHNRRIRFVCHS